MIGPVLMFLLVVAVAAAVGFVAWHAVAHAAGWRYRTRD